MYNQLIKYLKDDLKVFDREDCRKVREILRYLKENKNVPLKIIKEQTWEFYDGWCRVQDIIPLDDWSFYLIKTELSWTTVYNNEGGEVDVVNSTKTRRRSRIHFRKVSKDTK